MEDDIFVRRSFSQDETEVLVREVQSRRHRIYGTSNRPPRIDDVKSAWEEITNAVNACSSGPMRTVAQCRKRFNDVRRRGKQKLATARRESRATGGGPSSWPSSTPVEDVQLSIPFSSVDSFGGIEAGYQPPPMAATSPSAPAGPSCALASPSCAAGPSSAPTVEPDRAQRRGVRRRWDDDDQLFLYLQRGGFQMIEREFQTLNHTLNTRLTRLERAIRVGLAAINQTLSLVTASQPTPAASLAQNQVSAEAPSDPTAAPPLASPDQGPPVQQPRSPVRKRRSCRRK
ncbi:hypothetical protein SKAU_G00224460 [Synaphobranchus kaupii]|uniref:Myb-like domain-containing protein n=1 Tax=Synaphobranchus kaupii TaxID=118154 RepID=A0A9Q1FBB3_SYNKA|nr:hypothetical protein SKAU_G00224460 [Synaphobranchus kaupii]